MSRASHGDAEDRLFECVPNVSEGRNGATLDTIARAIERAGATLAHRTSDAAHHRSVFTFFGTRERVLAAALGLAHVAVAEVDLRGHEGAHPRIGALDVLPFIPFGSATMADAIELGREAARRIWHELGVPAYLYGEAARTPERRLLANVRRGGFEGLGTRADRPDVGERAHPSAGAVAIGARRVLIAFNVILASDDLALAQRIAGAVRERGGGLRTLRALGIRQSDGRVQISCNITDCDATPLYRIVALVGLLARPHGVAVAGSELIGLLPRAALEGVVAHAFGTVGRPPRAPRSLGGADDNGYRDHDDRPLDGPAARNV